MTIHYCCPFWGSEEDSVPVFFQKVLQAQYAGVEINLPASASFQKQFLEKLERIRASGQPDFVFIAQQVLPAQQESCATYLRRMEERLMLLATLRPDFINAHTGKDYFSFDENCLIIEAAENIASRTGIPVYHEIHRGRFTFHSYGLLRYLEKFPQLKLTGDISHWCTVSETMLQDQAAILKMVFPHIRHIHARIGFEQGPQVNDPFAPEWDAHRNTYFHWWKDILALQKEKQDFFTITPECGPAPYMPLLPFKKTPLSDQWSNNYKMVQFLKSNLLTS